jgi:hypothetical protein
MVAGLGYGQYATNEWLAQVGHFRGFNSWVCIALHFGQTISIEPEAFALKNRFGQ